MYSYEIDQIIKSKNYNIDSEEYIHICKSSSQIIRVKYESYNNDYEIWTNDNYYWRFKVYRKENEK